MVLVLEKDKIRARVGKFYVEGKEIKWDKKDRVEDENNEDEEDIVIESETAVQESETNKKESEVKKKLDVGETIPEVVNVKKHEVVDMKKQEVSPSPPKLIRMIPAIPLESGQDVAVFVALVERVKMVWVFRPGRCSSVPS